MKVHPLVVMWGGFAVGTAALLTILNTMALPPGTDFVCTTIRIEDVSRVRETSTGLWHVTVEDGFYVYSPEVGELCAVIP